MSDRYDTFEVFCEVEDADEEWLTIDTGDRVAVIAREEVYPGSEVRVTGDEGLLVLSRTYAEEVGLA